MRLPVLFLLLISLLSCSQNTVEQPPVAEKIVADTVKKFATKELEQKYYRLDTLFQNLYKANAFNGNVIVAQGGTIVYRNCFGIADKSAKLSLNEHSVFQLASVSKTITATAILLLADEGKLSLTDDVKKYLPDFPYQGVTIEHLISHRSGLSNYIYFSGAYIKDKSLQLSNNDVLELMKANQPKPYLKPGTRFNYCNTNYMLLALVLEKAAGKSYTSFIREKIFTPANMKCTWFEDELKGLPDSVKTRGYTFSMNEVEKDMFDNVYGDKGIYSTTYDLFLFNEALFSGKLLKPETLEQAILPHSKERKLSNYGYGWRMKNFSTPEKIVFHNGWWHGYRSALQRRLSDSTTVIILSNRLNSSVYNVNRVLQVLDGKIPGSIQLPEGEGEE